MLPRRAGPSRSTPPRAATRMRPTHCWVGAVRNAGRVVTRTRCPRSVWVATRTRRTRCWVVRLLWLPPAGVCAMAAGPGRSCSMELACLAEMPACASHATGACKNTPIPGGGMCGHHTHNLALLPLRIVQPSQREPGTALGGILPTWT